MRAAVAFSALLALAACSSDDDDDNETDDDGTTTGDTSGGDGDSGDEAGEGDTVDVTLTIEEEVPPLTTPAPDAAGSATLTVADDSAVSGEVTVSGLTGRATMAHIHVGAPGVAGPIAIALEENEDGTVWAVPEGANLTSTNEGDVSDEFAAGNLYFNVHTEANPSGELRGQIVPEGASDDEETTFTVRIANVSTETTLQNNVPIALSPGAYIVHREDASPILGAQQPATPALESLAEDGDPSGFPDAFAGAMVFNTPEGAEDPEPIGAGEAYEFEITASPGDKLSFVTMLIQSNDWFYTSTDEDDSISLFDEEGEPRSGDVSDEVALWDSGTELDEPMGTGPNQPMGERQMADGPNTGPVEGVDVGSLGGAGKLDGFRGQLTDPDASIIRVEITAQQ